MSIHPRYMRSLGLLVCVCWGGMSAKQPSDPCLELGQLGSGGYVEVPLAASQGLWMGVLASVLFRQSSIQPLQTASCG